MSTITTACPLDCPDGCSLLVTVEGDRITGIDAVTVSNQQLQLALPTLLWDLAFRVDGEVVNPTAIRKIRETDFQLYPNPARAGTSVVIRSEAATSPQQPVFALLDISGRQIRTFSPAEVQARDSEWEISLPASLSEGLYWLTIRWGEQSNAKPIMIRH